MDLIQQSININSEISFSQYVKGIFYKSMDNHADAVISFQRAKDLDPGNIEIQMIQADS